MDGGFDSPSIRRTVAENGPCQRQAANFFALLAILKAAVETLPDRKGKAGDLTGDIGATPPRSQPTFG